MPLFSAVGTGAVFPSEPLAGATTGRADQVECFPQFFPIFQGYPPSYPQPVGIAGINMLKLYSVIVLLTDCVCATLPDMAAEPPDIMLVELDEIRKEYTGHCSCGRTYRNNDRAMGGGR